MKRPVLITLLVIFVGIFLYSGYSLLNYVLDSRHNQAQFEALSQLVENARQNPPTVPPVLPDTSAPTVETAPEEVLITVTDPETGEAVQVLPEYADLYLLNNDLVGWLSIPDTNINYPVVQHPQERDYYLRRGFDREALSCGTLYVREECDVFTPSDNVTIYGHYMYDGSMFHDLHSFTDRRFWQTHKQLYFDTLRAHGTYEIIAVFKTTANEGGFPYYQFIDAEDAQAFDEFMTQCKALAFYETGVTAAYGDKLLCLSTCEYTLRNGRLVLLAKRIEA